MDALARSRRLVKPDLRRELTISSTLAAKAHALTVSEYGRQQQPLPDSADCLDLGLPKPTPIMLSNVEGSALPVSESQRCTCMLGERWSRGYV
jgi:hypothetical protein